MTTTRKRERDDLDELLDEINKEPTARCAMIENDLRRRIGAEFDFARKAKGVSIRDLAKEMQTSNSQVQRLLHTELGGSLTLRTLVRAADVLDLAVHVAVRGRCRPERQVVPIGSAHWTSCPAPTPVERVAARREAAVDLVGKKAWEVLDSESLRCSLPPEPARKSGS